MIVICMLTVGKKFKARTDQLFKEKLCRGHISDQWTTSESENWSIWKKLRFCSGL